MLSVIKALLMAGYSHARNEAIYRITREISEKHADMRSEISVRRKLTGRTWRTFEQVERAVAERHAPCLIDLPAKSSVKSFVMMKPESRRSNFRSI